MIFGRPGSGKSTFASYLFNYLNLPLYHLDKYFFVENWGERNYEEFLDIQQKIVDSDSWIIDGNSTRSLEMRFSKADLVLYFNFSRFICYFRIFKRFFKPNNFIKDRADGCSEIIKFSFLRYVYSFEKRVDTKIIFLKNLYPNVIFQEIRNDIGLDKLKNQLFNF